MTLSQALEVSAFGVLLGALLATLGWGFSRLANRSDARQRQDVLDTVTISDHGRTLSDLCGRVDKLERRVSGHGEELSALGAVMSRHESWHERHDNGHAPGRADGH